MYVYCMYNNNNIHMYLSYCLTTQSLFMRLDGTYIHIFTVSLAICDSKLYQLFVKITQVQQQEWIFLVYVRTSGYFHVQIICSYINVLVLCATCIHSLYALHVDVVLFAVQCSFCTVRLIVLCSTICSFVQYMCSLSIKYCTVFCSVMTLHFFLDSYLS